MEKKMEIKCFRPYKNNMLVSMASCAISVFFWIVSLSIEDRLIIDIINIIFLIFSIIIYVSSLVKVIISEHGIIYVGLREKNVRAFSWNELTYMSYYRTYKGFTWVFFSSDKLDIKKKRKLTFWGFQLFCKDENMIFFPTDSIYWKKMEFFLQKDAGFHMLKLELTRQATKGKKKKEKINKILNWHECDDCT